MQLTFLRPGEKQTIKAIVGKDEVRRYVEGLGFIAGETVEVLSQNNGNLIIMIKNTRVAIDKSIAMRIVV